VLEHEPHNATALEFSQLLDLRLRVGKWWWWWW
jgi:hypothetical protein